MRLRVAVVTLLVAVLTAVPTMAAHITDRLAVGLYAGAKDDEPERILTSGTPLEVLERGQRLCRVRMGNGFEGWLECQYLSDEKPARAMLVEAQARNGLLYKELEELKVQLEVSGQDVNALQRRLRAAERLLAKQTMGIPDAPPAIEPVPPQQADLAKQASGLSINGWVPDLISSLAGLVAGLIVGGLAFYMRCRLRYGGLGI